MANIALSNTETKNDQAKSYESKDSEISKNKLNNKPLASDKEKSTQTDKLESLMPMNNALIDKLLNGFSEKVEGKDGFWRFSYEDYVIQVITDERANRMRIIVPIAQDDILDEKLSYRLLQANFDSALDARYAIANDVIFSTFIHPLKELNDELFFSGLAQTIILAKTFGNSFSSGALIFNGGDSAAEQQKLYNDIIEKSKKRAI